MSVWLRRGRWPSVQTLERRAKRGSGVSVRGRPVTPQPSTMGCFSQIWSKWQRHEKSSFSKTNQSKKSGPALAQARERSDGLGAAAKMPAGLPTRPRVPNRAGLNLELLSRFLDFEHWPLAHTARLRSTSERVAGDSWSQCECPSGSGGHSMCAAWAGVSTPDVPQRVPAGPRWGRTLHIVNIRDVRNSHGRPNARRGSTVASKRHTKPSEGTSMPVCRAVASEGSQAHRLRGLELGTSKKSV